jgi:hypothetical protein
MVIFRLKAGDDAVTITSWQTFLESGIFANFQIVSDESPQWRYFLVMHRAAGIALSNTE